MESIAVDPSYKPKKLFFPIRLLPLMRDRMAKMLKEFDWAQEIGPSSPSPLPKWMKEEGIFHAVF